MQYECTVGGTDLYLGPFVCTVRDTGTRPQPHLLDMYHAHAML